MFIFFEDVICAGVKFQEKNNRKKLNKEISLLFVQTAYYKP